MEEKGSLENILECEEHLRMVNIFIEKMKKENLTQEEEEEMFTHLREAGALIRWLVMGVRSCPNCYEPISDEIWDNHRECHECGLIVNPADIEE